MKVYASVKFMGAEINVSPKDNKTYHKVGFMQGLESRIFYVDQKTYDILAGVVVGTELDVMINISDRDGKTYFSLEDYQIKSADKAKVTNIAQKVG